MDSIRSDLHLIRRMLVWALLVALAQGATLLLRLDGWLPQTPCPAVARPGPLCCWQPVPQILRLGCYRSSSGFPPGATRRFLGDSISASLPSSRGDFLLLAGCHPMHLAAFGGSPDAAPL